jgi:hypothetical protein
MIASAALRGWTLNRSILMCVLPLLSLLAAQPAPAGPIPRDRVPPPLQPWTDWALRGQEGALCAPFLGGEEKRCSWPGLLSLDLGETAGSFRQEWTLETAGFVPLPGEARRWPLDLQVDGRPAAAVERQGTPGLWLPAGTHAVSGAFRWDILPESLPVPPEVGLVGLTVRGTAVLLPERDASGRVFLRSGRSVQTEEDRLDVRVERKVIDSVPLVLVTRIELAVAGKAREVLLGRALPDHFIPLSLAGPLPARLEPNGHVRVQVRPGNWAIELAARHTGPATALTAPRPGGPWAAEEVWVFEAQPGLRLADVEGVPAVDPQQTTLPDEWKVFPAWRLLPGQTLRFTVRRRGAADLPADRLSLRRQLWLDFDGGGYTWQDALEGTLHRSWRLEMAPPSRLERVSISDPDQVNRDQVITRRPGAELTGIEVREGKIALAAEGRLPGRWSLPAVGWNHDFQEVSGILHLPPGWRLLGTTGIDQVPGTWIGQWTLLDFFLVLLIALAVRHLWGNRWAVLALATLILTWQEPDAPQWIWIFVLVAEALRRAGLAEKRAQWLTRVFSGIALAVLALVTVAFLAQQIRYALYPAVELPWSMGGQAEEAAFPTAASPPESSSVPERYGKSGSFDVDSFARKARERPDLQEMDPRAVVSTGPGLPAWEWRTVELRWSGPVDKEQRMRLFLVPPAGNFVLTFVRAALLLLLVLRALAAAGLRIGRRPPPAATAAATVLLLALVLTGPATAQEAVVQEAPAAEPAPPEAPPSRLLDELRTALLAPPDCHPECASSPRLFVDVSPGALRLRFEVGAAAAVAVPLPAGPQWLPAEVRIDGQPATIARTSDGRLWTRIEPGRHEILLSGPLPGQGRETVQIPLPLRPHRVDATAAGWTVDGIHEDGQADDSLQLTRVRALPAGAPAGALQPGEVPPFLEVSRVLHLGLTWTVETRVRRLSPPGVPVAVAVPLLPGESVTTAGIRVQKGVAQVSLGPQTPEAAWSSTLAPRAELRLTAPRGRSDQGGSWTEVWQLAASPVWHVEAQGIPPVLGPEDAAVRIPEWRPWPGESVVLAISRPAGIDGQTLTIDKTALTVSPGLRSTDAQLEIRLRSSRGGRHTIVLPAGAELQTVSIDGRTQPIQQEDREVTLPIRPGQQVIQLAWREPRGISLLFRSPEVDLGTGSVNADLVVRPPSSRWILLLGGPRLGPAVLFWSLLVVILLTAWLLGRIRITPLTTRDWVLLGIGLSQVPLVATAIVAGWLLALGLRRERGEEIRRPFLFDLAQILLALWTLVALGILFWGVQAGLLGTPDMQIAGNGSWASELHWYADRTGELLPRAWIFSVPLLLYRLAMLAWALWLALALLRWLRWGWESLNTGGGWRPWKPRLWRRRRDGETDSTAEQAEQAPRR